jgi:hypothetical protein
MYSARIPGVAAQWLSCNDRIRLCGYLRVDAHALLLHSN